jgi:hypothetical protein
MRTSEGVSQEGDKGLRRKEVMRWPLGVVSIFSEVGEYVSIHRSMRRPSANSAKNKKLFLRLLRTTDRQWAYAKAWLIRRLVKFLGGNPVDSAYEQNGHELFIRSGKDDIL